LRGSQAAAHLSRKLAETEYVGWRYWGECEVFEDAASEIQRRRRGRPCVEGSHANSRVPGHILQRLLTELWDSCPAQVPLQVGVWLFNLVPDELHTLSLFEDDEKRYTISTVVDELNQRYGQNAVYFGGIHSVLDSAPTRISFTSIPDVDDF
jgi:hypothetical protein